MAQAMVDNRGGGFRQQQFHQQQFQQHQQEGSWSSAPASANGRHQRNEESDVKDVWADTLVEEMARLRDAAEEYPYVAMETVFPGIVARPMGAFRDHLEQNYETLKVNVELMKVMQIAFTFCDADGRRPPGVHTWRFNFSFDQSRDLYAEEALDSLRRRRGLDLERLRVHGIDPLSFGELLTPSGLVLNEDIKWITFLGTKELSEHVIGKGSIEDQHWIIFSGMYDFVFLLRLLTSKTLPEELPELVEDLGLFFPNRVDLGKFIGRIANCERQLREKPEYFKDCQRLMETFFKLPDQVRATAFDKK